MSYVFCELYNFGRVIHFKVNLNSLNLSKLKKILVQKISIVSCGECLWINTTGDQFCLWPNFTDTNSL